MANVLIAAQAALIFAALIVSVVEDVKKLFK